MAFKKDNNELLLFILKQLVRDQINFYRNRYTTEPDIIDIQEDEFADRVRNHIRIIINFRRFKLIPPNTSSLLRYLLLSHDV